MTTERPAPDDEVSSRLLAQTHANAPLARMMRTGLESLRNSPDPEIRRATTAVLEGRLTVRGLVEVPAFTRAMTTAAAEAQRQLAEMEPEERAKALAEAEEKFRSGS